MNEFKTKEEEVRPPQKFFADNPQGDIDFILANQKDHFREIDLVYPWYNKVVDHIMIQGYGVAIVISADGTWHLEDTTGG